MGEPQGLPAITLIIQDDITTGPPDMDSETGQGGIGIDELALAVELEVVFGLEGVLFWVRVLRVGRGLDALGDVGHDFLRTQHSVRVEPCVAIWRCDAGEAVLPWLEHEADFDSVFVRDLVLCVQFMSDWSGARPIGGRG